MLLLGRTNKTTGDCRLATVCSERPGTGRQAAALQASSKETNLLPKASVKHKNLNKL